MDFYWIGFTLIWIACHQQGLTTAASLRSESLDLSNPDAIDTSKSQPEQNIQVEESNYNRINTENTRHRYRPSIERRNRQIYTSKTYFGRNPLLELPRKYWNNKEDEETAPFRTKGARYMYPEKHRKLVPHRFHITDNYQHNIPDIGHQIQRVSKQNIQHATIDVNGPNPNYNSNLGYVDRGEYGLNAGYPNVGHPSNPEYNANVRYYPEAEQNVNAGFIQNPYDVNAGYVQYDGNDPKDRHGQNPGHGTNARQNPGYDPNARQGPEYDANVGHGQNPGYGTNARQNPGYDPNARQGPEYDINAEPGQYPKYGANFGQVQNPKHGIQAEHGQYSGFNANSGHGQDPGFDANAGHRQNPGVYANAGYGQEYRFDANTRHGQEPRYDPNAGNFQVPIYGTNDGNVQIPEHGIQVGNGQYPGYNTNAGYEQDNGYPIIPENGHGSKQNINTEYESSDKRVTNAEYNLKTTHKANTEYNPNTFHKAIAGFNPNSGLEGNTYGETNDESKDEINMEKVELKNEEFKQTNEKKEVIQKLEEMEAEHNLDNKETKKSDKQKDHMNNEHHTKILNRYNQLLLSEKSNSYSSNKNKETVTSTVSNLDFISDENLSKDELFRHVSGENSFKSIPADQVSDELDVTKTSFIEEIEGSGNVESFNEPLISSDQELNKTARVLEVFSSVDDSKQCITPKNESGHCRGLTECPLIELIQNFSSFLQYVCLQRGRLVGICCPDNPVIEISDALDGNSKDHVQTDIQQPPEGCGLSTNTRIVGGTMSLPHEFSWMVALLRRDRFYCGGVIINNWYILTAAHCVLGIKVSDLKVRLGEFDLFKTTDHQQDIPVAEIKRHALFVTLTFQHDIALLKLKRRIEYTKFIGSICLPNKDEGDFTARNATVVGWGTVSFGGSASPILRQVTVPVWDNKQCDQTYVFERINDAFMCAGSPGSGEDACQGDSGGPLMTMNDEGRWSVIGIVSWGRRCGDPTYPGVYTRVTSYLDWIAENAR